MRQVAYTLSLCGFLILPVLLVGCGNRTLKWEQVTDNPKSWAYLCAREARLHPPPVDASIRDDALALTDVDLLTYDELNRATNGGVILAMRHGFLTGLVTGSVEQAAIPENRGKVLPVVVDRKMEIHFLSRTSGQWYSTNVLHTRTVSLQHTR